MVRLFFGSKFPEERKNYFKKLHKTTVIFSVPKSGEYQVFCSARDKKEIHKQFDLNRLQWPTPEFGRNSIILHDFCQKLHGNIRDWIGAARPQRPWDPPMFCTD